MTVHFFIINVHYVLRFQYLLMASRIIELNLVLGNTKIKETDVEPLLFVEITNILLWMVNGSWRSSIASSIWRRINVCKEFSTCSKDTFNTDKLKKIFPYWNISSIFLRTPNTVTKSLLKSSQLKLYDDCSVFQAVIFAILKAMASTPL